MRWQKCSLQNKCVSSANWSKYETNLCNANIKSFIFPPHYNRSLISSIYLVPSNGCQSSWFPLLTSIFRLTQFSSRHWILLPFSTPLWSSVLSKSKFRLHLHINFIAIGIGMVVVDDVVYSVLSNKFNDIFFVPSPNLIKPYLIRSKSDDSV